MTAESHQEQHDHESVHNWLENLYKHTFKVSYKGMEFEFKKHYPTSILTKWEKLERSVQSLKLVSFCSVNPKMNYQLVGQLPPVLIQMVANKLKEFNKEETQGESKGTSQ